ncbi:GNAT family N-acetyltransferase [Methanofollis tationis]|uniref:GNAT family N-acetyltransferase n=1 Tax=Methanofollis tationis TaxID=81417 RepID=A0A7K4HKS2_9EURY|nr:GNAT family N-acetyltransferase [Methanofollis tationis]NVO65876.1 GNAT family N-acetyltransferase [Methanofollis tationis]
MNDSTTTIREAGDGDLEAVLTLYEHLHDADEPADEDETRAAWRAIMEDGRTHLFILESGGVPVSTCMLSIVPNLTRRARPFGIVENVVTRRQDRRRGYATALLHHALGYAWERTCYKVMLLTGRKDEAVLEF